ncbi:MAG: preprotein translocase subunit SecG [Micrococcus sp.]|nr:preprotein translocase subunit SecG [Micrococcus sp.]
MDALLLPLQILVAVLSVFLVLLVLFHKGRGGGVSDMFGGGVSSAMSSSGSSQRLLTRITVTIALIWGVAIVLVGVFARLSVDF